MSAKDNGGPAFARPIGEYKEVGAGKWCQEQPGMSLRDYFAAAALPAVFAAAAVNGSGDQEAISAEAYEIADAMLAERTK